MANITASDVNALRKQTGAGMMDCKKALVEAQGDFETAIDLLRKQGQKVAAKRGEREANEGVIIAKSKGKHGVLIVLNCETDFVAKNEDFVKFAYSILDTAIENKPASLDALKALKIGPITIEEKIAEQTGVIGEKIDLSAYEQISAEEVVAYIHPGNRLAAIVGLNKTGHAEVGKDVAMQIAAMDPVAVDKDGVSTDIIEREMEIGKELARAEGKPENMIDKIAEGKLNKFYKENTLLNQQSIKDNKKTVAQILNEAEKGLTVTAFKRRMLS